MTQNEWVDISSEEYREYVYPDGKVIRIDEPTFVKVSPSSLGGHAHRVQNTDGMGFYIPYGWRYIRWKAKAGESIFVA